MTLTELIAVFKSRTGRLDLTDAEITILLNQACRTLDELEDSDLRIYRGFFKVLAGDYIAQLPPEFRLERTVTLHQDDESWVLSKRIDSTTLRALIRDEGMVDQNLYCGTNEYIYTIIRTGFTQDFAANELPVFMDTVGLQTQIDDRNLYIAIYPKVAEESVLEVEMIAYTVPLSSVQTTNYWSLRFPDLIIQACNYHLVKDLLSVDTANSILKELKLSVSPVSFDLYAQQNITQMEG